ncbi:unnamed protein product [Larinioides sclopetarius]|uniref:Transposable element P transposase-like RNase H domain-containing protein n=1 Tax=Larinioides sclopetarius TaxID=280406 RepID=A0AAV1ZS66_9ARAC
MFKNPIVRMSESGKLCVLTIDEMSIKPAYGYAANLDCVDGFISFIGRITKDNQHLQH